MAYVINPDGTVSSIGVEYDSSGNISPKKSYDMLDHYESKVTPKPLPSPFKKRKKKKMKQAQSSGVSVMPNMPGKVAQSSTTKPLQEEKEKKVSKPSLFLTRQSIDEFFKKLEASRKTIPAEIYMYAVHTLKSNLLGYFLEHYKKYLEKCSNLVKTEKQGKENKKRNKKKKKKREQSNSSYSERLGSGHTLADIATFSSLRSATTSEDIIMGRSVFGASRQPVYGYARDRYGRIQERDKLDENKKNEFRQAQSRQSNYDFSMYDKEDDHDGYYESNSYD